MSALNFRLELSESARRDFRDILSFTLQTWGERQFVECRQKEPTMIEIRAQWDDEARVWWATSDDVPGLCVQADTFDELAEIATALAPELLEANRVATADPIRLHTTQFEALPTRIDLC